MQQGSWLPSAAGTQAQGEMSSWRRIVQAPSCQANISPVVLLREAAPPMKQHPQKSCPCSSPSLPALTQDMVLLRGLLLLSSKVQKSQASSSGAPPWPLNRWRAELCQPFPHPARQSDGGWRGRGWFLGREDLSGTAASSHPHPGPSPGC